MLPEALLELFRLLSSRSLALRKPVKLEPPWGKGLGHRLAGVVAPMFNDGDLRCIFGVANIESCSSGSIGSRSSSLLESSEPSMFMLPTELDPVFKSPAVKRGESTNMELNDCFRGFIMARWAKAGDESGDDWSARVEWWRLVTAREKSMPRECRGRTLAGDP